MLRSFLAWMEQAPVAGRIEAVTLLAGAYLSRALGGERPEDVEAGLTLVLDDPAPPVRRALARAFADRPDVPRHVVRSLARDVPEVSALVLARSPLLAEADLRAAAREGKGLQLVALALRPEVSTALAAALVARDDKASALALAGNAGAEVSEADLLRLVGRFGGEAKLRAALLARPDLPPSVRHAIEVVTGGTLGRFAIGGGFLPAGPAQTGVDEALLAATLTIGEAAGAGLPRYLAYLRANGFLTPALRLRSLLGGDSRFFAAALGELGEIAPAKAEGLVASRSEGAVLAVLRRADVPAFVVPALVAAVRAGASVPADQRSSGAAPEELAIPVVQAAVAATLDRDDEESVALLAVLRRYETDAARAQSRALAALLRAEAIEAWQDAREAAPLAIEGTVIEGATHEVESLRPETHRAAGMPDDGEVPDLKSIISAWKREREQRDFAALAAIRDRVETNDPYADWELRKSA